MPAAHTPEAITPKATVVTDSVLKYLPEARGNGVKISNKKRGKRYHLACEWWTTLNPQAMHMHLLQAAVPLILSHNRGISPDEKQV